MESKLLNKKSSDFNGVVVNILGTSYTIEVRPIDEDEIMKKNHLVGRCSGDSKRIIIVDMEKSDEYLYFDNDDERVCYLHSTLRHEIIHAFFIESGLAESSLCAKNWAINEEMVDWIAVQFPKMYKIFESLDIL